MAGSPADGLVKKVANLLGMEAVELHSKLREAGLVLDPLVAGDYPYWAASCWRSRIRLGQGMPLAASLVDLCPQGPVAGRVPVPGVAFLTILKGAQQCD